MITRNIARPIFRSVSRSILRPTGENALTKAINTARNALNIHPEQQTGSAYLVQKTPTLAGVVQDETPTRKDRTRLSCRASDFDGINQRFQRWQHINRQNGFECCDLVSADRFDGTSDIIRRVQRRQGAK